MFIGESAPQNLQGADRMKFQLEELEKGAERARQAGEYLETMTNAMETVHPLGSTISTVAKIASGAEVGTSDVTSAAIESIPAGGIGGKAVKALDKAGDAVKVGGIGKSSTKGLPHGDGGRALSKAEKQINDLNDRLKTAVGKEKKMIQKKIENIQRTAEKKAKGETHWRR